MRAPPLAGLAALAGLLASGCMGPRPKVPASAAVGAPAAWRTDPGPAGDPLPDWWKSFHDPILDRLVERAIANNTDILTAASRIQEADAAMRLARSAQSPTLDLTALGLPREKTYSTVTGMGVYVSGYEIELGASYDADLFGRLRNQTAAARATLLGTKAAAATVRIATIASVIETYVSIRALDAALQVARDTLASRQRQLALVTHQARVGYVVQVSVSAASAEVHSVEQQIVSIQQQLAQAEDALAVLLGDNPETIPRGLAVDALPLLDTPATMPARLLRRRPDIYEAEQAIVAADRSLDSARAAFMPDLQISAKGDRLDANLLPSPLWLYSFMGTVLAPIFEGGKLRANQDAAAARRDQAAFAYRKAALSAFQEVEDDLSDVQKLRLKEIAAVAQRQDEAAALHAAQRRFDAGYSSYQEVLDAERGLLSAQLTVVQTRGDRLTAIVKVYQAMGGGWPAPEGGRDDTVPRMRRRGGASRVDLPQLRRHDRLHRRDHAQLAARRRGQPRCRFRAAPALRLPAAVTGVGDDAR